jgi:hypothetical protein
VKTTRFIVNFEEQENLFSKKGNFKLNEMVDIIFEQPNIPYLITRKFCNGLFTIVQKKIWCAIMGTILKDEF